MIEIKKAVLEQLTDLEKDKLFNILIDAYALTEMEIWGPNYIRISKEDYFNYIKKGEVLIAYYQEELVGTVHVYERADKVFTFSLLAVDFDKAGLGIGAALVEAVEAKARSSAAKAMQIEVLRAKDEYTDFKKRIANWYKRLGYQFTHKTPFEELEPQKGEKLLQAADFDYYWKNL